MKKVVFAVTAVLALLCLCVAAQAVVNIETVRIGDAGNAADWTGYGDVGYNYNIGKYEVTAGQYTEFLNAVAATDTYGLYNMEMWSDSQGCKIQRSDGSGSYSYSVASDYANRPVNFVSYWDSCRFVNWLGTGSTENGAYTLGGYNSTDGRTIQRNAGWKYAVTSEDEWYKAAYYKGGGVYSIFANGTNGAPGMEIDANYGGEGGTYSTTWDGTIHGALEQNGTKDMMGNVWEWNEAIEIATRRGLRGGSFWGLDSIDSYLASPSRDGQYPTNENFNIGFRVSQVAPVPEPSSLIALAGGLIGLFGLRRRKA